MARASIREASKATKTTRKIKMVSEPTTAYFPNGQQVTSSHDSEEVLRQIYKHEGFDIELYEVFTCLFLNRANKVIGYYVHSIGGMAGTVVDAKLVFASALLCGAHIVILCHNHPSGNRKPSKEDIHLTRNLISGGKFLSIQVVDHIILCAEGYYSFADEGEMTE